ncbi:unnamed protein product [Amoebophrya sp. A120]|nr:unnamed protein product [Amoebophrya sp. A120]|eukprot:GSA120T00008950001.1
MLPPRSACFVSSFLLLLVVTPSWFHLCLAVEPSGDEASVDYSKAAAAAKTSLEKKDHDTDSATSATSVGETSGKTSSASAKIVDAEEAKNAISKIEEGTTKSVGVAPKATSSTASSTPSKADTTDAGAADVLGKKPETSDGATVDIKTAAQKADTGVAVDSSAAKTSTEAAGRPAAPASAAPVAIKPDQQVLAAATEDPAATKPAPLDQADTTTAAPTAKVLVTSPTAAPDTVSATADPAVVPTAKLESVAGAVAVTTKTTSAAGETTTTDGTSSATPAPASTAPPPAEQTTATPAGETTAAGAAAASAAPAAPAATSAGAVTGQETAATSPASAPVVSSTTAPAAAVGETKPTTVTVAPEDATGAASGTATPVAAGTLLPGVTAATAAVPTETAVASAAPAAVIPAAATQPPAPPVASATQTPPTEIALATSRDEGKSTAGGTVLKQVAPRAGAAPPAQTPMPPAKTVSEVVQETPSIRIPLEHSDISPHGACKKLIQDLSCGAETVDAGGAASPPSTTFRRKAICIREKMIEVSLHNKNPVEELEISKQCLAEVESFFLEAGEKPLQTLPEIAAACSSVTCDLQGQAAKGEERFFCLMQSYKHQKSSAATTISAGQVVSSHLSKTCRDKLYAYHVLSHRNKEMCTEVVSKCDSGLQQHCTAQKILNGKKEVTANGMKTVNWVAWPLQKECLRNQGTNLESSCRAALFRAEIGVAISRYNNAKLGSSGGGGGRFYSAGELRPEDGTSTNEGESGRVGDETGTTASSAAKSSAESAAASQKRRLDSSTTTAPGISNATSKATTAASPTTSASPDSLDFYPLLRTRCEQDVQKHCLSWANKLKCLEVLANNDERKLIRPQIVYPGGGGGGVNKDGTTSKINMTTTSNALGWQGFGTAMKPSTSTKTTSSGNNLRKTKTSAFSTTADVVEHDQKRTTSSSGKNHRALAVEQNDEKQKAENPLPEQKQNSTKKFLNHTGAISPFKFMTDSIKNSTSAALAALRKSGLQQSKAVSALPSAGLRQDLALTTVCRAQVKQTIRQKYRDIRLSPELAKNCVGDIDLLCKTEKQKMLQTDLPSGQVLHCLRRRYYEIQQQDCVDSFRLFMQTFQLDWAADSVTKKACNADRQLFCQNVKTSLVHVCLQEHIDELDVECQKQEFMVSSFAQLDVNRFNPYLSRMCLLDLDKHCPLDSLGGSDIRAITCLRKVPKHQLHTSCEIALKNNALRTNQDFRLKFGVTNNCEEEIQNKCQKEASLAKPEGKVLQCLIEKLDKNELTVAHSMGELVNPNSIQRTKQLCKQEVEELAKQFGQNIQSAKQINLACAEDIEKFCKNVEPGFGQIHDCLVDNLTRVSKECAAKEMALQNVLAGGKAGGAGGANAAAVILPPSLEKCCENDIGRHCGNFSNRVNSNVENKGKLSINAEEKLTCLISKQHAMNFNYKCRECVQRHVKRQNKDYRLNPGLKKECAPIIDELCKKEKEEQKKHAGGGLVIQCLIDNRNRLQANPGCLKAVQLKIRQRADDYRVAPFFHTACEDDLNRFCFDVKPGGGKVHKCLNAHLSELSPACKHLEFRQQMQTDPSNDPQIRLYCIGMFSDATKPCFQAKKNNALFSCLDKHRDNAELITPNCAKAVKGIGEKKAKSILYNKPIGERCAATLARFIEKEKCEPGTLPFNSLPSGYRPVQRQATSGGPTAPLVKTVSADASRMPLRRTSVAAFFQENERRLDEVKTGPASPLPNPKAVTKAFAKQLANTINEQVAKRMDQKKPGSGLKCLVDNMNLIEDRSCKLMVLRQAQMHVRNPFLFRPGFREACEPIADKSCAGAPGGLTKNGLVVPPYKPMLLRALLGQAEDVDTESEVDVEQQQQLGLVLLPWADEYEEAFTLPLASAEELISAQADFSAGAEEILLEETEKFLTTTPRALEEQYLADHYSEDFLLLEPSDEQDQNSLQIQVDVDYADEKENYSQIALDPYTRQLATQRWYSQAIAKENVKCLLDMLPSKSPDNSRMTPSCAKELQSFSILTSTDIRLHPQLERRCGVEIAKFCGHLKPGNSRILVCLKAEMEATAPPGVGFSKMCQVSVSRVALSKSAIETYTKFHLNSGITAKTLQRLGFIKQGQFSFLTLRGPVALLALLSMIFSFGTVLYYFYRRRKTAGYTSYVPDNLNIGTMNAGVAAGMQEHEDAEVGSASSSSSGGSGVTRSGFEKNYQDAEVVKIPPTTGNSKASSPMKVKPEHEKKNVSGNRPPAPTSKPPGKMNKAAE